MYESINRRAVIKGTAATLAVATCTMPALAKAEFDPAAYVSESDRLGYCCIAHVNNGKLQGLYIAEPDEYPPGYTEAYHELIGNARKTKNWTRQVGEYLMSIGRTY